MVWCSLVGADRSPCNAGCQAGIFGFVCPLVALSVATVRSTL